MFRGGTCLQVLTTDSLDSEDVFLSKKDTGHSRRLPTNLKRRRSFCRVVESTGNARSTPLLREAWQAARLTC